MKDDMNMNMDMDEYINSDAFNLSLDNDLAIAEANNRMQDAFVSSSRFIEVIHALESVKRSSEFRLPQGISLEEYQRVCSHIHFTEKSYTLDSDGHLYYYFGDLTMIEYTSSDDEYRINTSSLIFSNMVNL